MGSSWRSLPPVVVSPCARGPPRRLDRGLGGKLAQVLVFEEVEQVGRLLIEHGRQRPLV
jgi:hypothetical protein